jgi:hypothetical protein
MKIRQKIKGLRLNFNGAGSAPQFVATDIERVAAGLEPQDPSRPPWKLAASSANNQGNLGDKSGTPQSFTSKSVASSTMPIARRRRQAVPLLLTAR